MSLIPAFQIGVWNGWIPVLYMLIGFALIPALNKGAMEAGNIENSLSKKEKTIMNSYHIILLVECIYCIFLPFQLGTVWFYAGLVIILLGLVLYTPMIVSFITTPIQDELITKGSFRFSRHPMYVSMAIVFFGIGIAGASWLLILLTIAYTVLALIHSINEERGLLAQYGERYQRYTEISPRWLGIPKSW